MAGRRVYLPMTASLLAAARDRGGFGPSPLRAHAVTARLREELGGADEEECEYAATTAAAHDAVGLLGPEDPPVRLVAAVDVARFDEPGAGAAASAVTVPDPVPIRMLAAVLADSDDAREAVAAARAAGDPAAAPGHELGHELGWYAAQEVPELLDRLSGDVPRSADGRRHPPADPGQRAEPHLRTRQP